MLDAASQEGGPWLLCMIRLKVTSPPVQLQSSYCVLLRGSGSPRTALTQAHAMTPVAPGGAPSRSAKPALGPGLSAHSGGRNREGATVTQRPSCPSIPFSLRGQASSIAAPPLHKTGVKDTHQLLGYVVISWALAQVLEVPVTSFLSVLTDMSLLHGPGRASGSGTAALRLGSWWEVTWAPDDEQCQGA